jgi:hypothetical protein
MSHRERIEEALARTIKSGRVPMAVEVSPHVYEELRMENIPAAPLVTDGQAAPVYREKDLVMKVFESEYGEFPIIKREGERGQLVAELRTTETEHAWFIDPASLPAGLDTGGLDKAGHVGSLGQGLDGVGQTTVNIGQGLEGDRPADQANVSNVANVSKASEAGSASG